MFGLGAGELLVIAVFALIFLGPKKLPELARSLGKGIREFQKAKDEIMNQVNTSEDQNQSKTPPAIAESKDDSKHSKEEELKS